MKWTATLILAALLSACHSPEQTVQSGNISQTESHQQAKTLLNKGIQAYEQQKYTDAMTAFTQASAAGQINAPRYIGLMYLNGYGVEKNARRAVAEFNKAAEWGDIAAQFWLGYCYEQGIGIDQNREKAVKWYRLSAEQGNAAAAPAMTALGRLAEQDNLDEAVNWYRKSAAVGAKEAQSALRRLGIQPS